MRAAEHAHTQCDAAAFGELDRIGKQVGEDLIEARGIAFQRRGQVVGDVQLQRDPLEMRRYAHDGVQPIQQFAGTECHARDQQLAGFDFREIQHIRDHSQQQLARDIDLRDQSRLFRVQRRLLEKIGQADHRVHRRANLVAHVGEKQALGVIRSLRVLRRMA